MASNAAQRIDSDRRRLGKEQTVTTRDHTPETKVPEETRCSRQAGDTALQTMHLGTLGTARLLAKSPVARRSSLRSPCRPRVLRRRHEDCRSAAADRSRHRCATRRAPASARSTVNSATDLATAPTSNRNDVARCCQRNCARVRPVRSLARLYRRPVRATSTSLPTLCDHLDCLLLK